MGLDNGITARVTHNDTEIQDFDVCHWCGSPDDLWELMMDDE